MTCYIQKGKGQLHCAQTMTIFDIWLNTELVTLILSLSEDIMFLSANDSVESYMSI